MHRVVCFLFASVLLVSCPNLQENRMYLGDGYLNNGIHYEIYRVDVDTNHLLSVNESYSVDISYDGFVEPPKTYECSVYIDGILHKGTLKLTAVKYKASKTIATYTGKLYPA